MQRYDREAAGKTHIVSRGDEDLGSKHGKDRGLSRASGLPDGDVAKEDATVHTPVLLAESIDLLNVHPGGLYIDGTLGTGGHSKAILEKCLPGCRLLAIDLDPAAIEIAKARLGPHAESVTFVNDNFRNVEAICNSLGFRPVDGVILDLGISSAQIDDARRGFSFRFGAPLDMRFSPAQETKAAHLVNELSEKDLAQILATYGEERRGRLIARRIVASRPIFSTLELARIVESALGRPGKIHPATRTFQALRIATNEELVNLESTLKQLPALLRARGRLAIISYHSLEDRIVKEFLKNESRDCICPPSVPVCRCEHAATLRVLTKKAVRPTPSEQAENPRSRSARLRAAECL